MSAAVTCSSADCHDSFFTHLCRDFFPIRAPTVRWLLEVNIGVSKGTPGDHVPTDPDREDRSGWAEFLVQHGLGHILMQVPDVQGGHGVTGSAGIHIQVLTKYSDEAKKFSTAVWML